LEKIVVNLLHDFERGHITRRQLVQSLVLGMMAPAALAESAGGFKAISVNHISLQVADYRRTRDFYADLLGMKVGNDTGEQVDLTFGDTVLIARNAKDTGAAPLVDHIAYSIADWDRERVEAELKRRGLDPKPDFQGSFHVRDPDGYLLQIAAPEFMTMTE
jgi:catechol 2,3-dioxygenase-like lactoylglutathione lyase family enzyme